jgi:hypothetical protein
MMVWQLAGEGPTACMALVYLSLSTVARKRDFIKNHGRTSQPHFYASLDVVSVQISAHDQIEPQRLIGPPFADRIGERTKGSPRQAHLSQKSPPNIGMSWHSRDLVALEKINKSIIKHNQIKNSPLVEQSPRPHRARLSTKGISC